MENRSTIRRIYKENMHEFAEKIERAEVEFIPMLPFVRLPLHDFDRYKHYHDKGIYLIDELGNGPDSDYCLYHLYHLTDGDDTLRVTLVLPSSWEKRFEIMEKSIPNLKQWFLQEDPSGQFIIQSLEYGEIEYYPTLSHYLIPTIIRNGFTPKYRMYMKRALNKSIEKAGSLGNGLSLVNYSDELFSKVEDFYYHNETMKNYYYFTNCTHEEFQQMYQDGFTTAHSKYIVDQNGTVVAGIIVSRDSDRIWIDNFSVSPKYDGSGIGEYLLCETVDQLAKACVDVDVDAGECIYIYLNRDCRDAVAACQANGFVPFEFWTDMILAR